MYEINVSCKQFPTTDKFSELLNLAQKAKDDYDSVYSSCNKVINEVGESKYLIILRQLQPICEAFNKLCALKGEVQYVTVYDKNYVMRIKGYAQSSYVVEFKNADDNFNFHPFSFYSSKNKMCSPYGILTHWGELDMIARLEKAVEDAYTDYIGQMKTKGEKVVKHAENMCG